MRDQIERKIKRCDANDRTQRNSSDMRNTPLISGQPVERDDLAVVALRLFRRNLEGIHSAIYFQSCRSQRLSGFQRDDAREFLAPRRNALTHLQQHSFTLP